METIGRYHIKQIIGHGGMATVYLAHDPRFNREVAIKVLPPQFTHDPQFRARFEREAQTIASLEHSAIVPVYDFGQEQNQPYLVMRYMSGGSLADKLAMRPLSLAEAISVIKRIAAALDYAHARGVIHRDLKPGNILFDQSGEAVLADFGIAKLAQETNVYTATHGIVGTPAYMSPEQVRGEKLDGRSDIYALGVLLYETLSGKPPYQADTPMGLAYKHVHDPTPQLPNDIAKTWQPLIDKAMAKNPDRRFDTGLSMVSAISIAADSLGTVKLTSTPVISTDKKIAAGRKNGWLIGIMLVFITAVFGGLWLNNANQLNPVALIITTATPAHTLASTTRARTISPTQNSVLLPTSTLQPTSTKSPTKTATPRPTNTPTVRSTATLTIQPQLTATVSEPTAQPTAIPTIVQTPLTLKSMSCDNPGQFFPNQTIKFEWDWDDNLSNDAYWEIKINAESIASGIRSEAKIGNSWEYSIPANQLNVSIYPTDFQWQLVRHANSKIVQVSDAGCFTINQSKSNNGSTSGHGDTPPPPPRP